MFLLNVRNYNELNLTGGPGGYSGWRRRICLGTHPRGSTSASGTVPSVVPPTVGSEDADGAVNLHSQARKTMGEALRF
jgi:hypothetical protein